MGKAKWQPYMVFFEEEGCYYKMNVDLPNDIFDEYEGGSSVSGDARDMLMELSEALDVPVKMIINQKIKDEMLNKISGISCDEIRLFGFPLTPKEYENGSNNFRKTDGMSDKDIKIKLREIFEFWNDFKID